MVVVECYCRLVRRVRNAEGKYTGIKNFFLYLSAFLAAPPPLPLCLSPCFMCLNVSLRQDENVYRYRSAYRTHASACDVRRKEESVKIAAVEVFGLSISSFRPVSLLPPLSHVVLQGLLYMLCLFLYLLWYLHSSGVTAA